MTIMTAVLAVLLTPIATYCRSADTQWKPVGVVELFTSQGCSSCPKADESLNLIADNPDIVSISYHVDYWNYLGWEDTLSAKENTERQYGYGKTFGNQNVFTPQMVLNGVSSAKSTSASAVMKQLDAMKLAKASLEVPLTASMRDEEMTINVGEGTGKASIVVAYYRRKTTVAIKSGENNGRRVVYRNAVAKMETVGMWDGKAMTVKLPTSTMEKSGFDGCAVLLQAQDSEGNPGRIYGAIALTYDD